MQANVKHILTKAAEVEALVAKHDRPVMRQDDFPGFFIISREKVFESKNTTNSHYDGNWDYGCMIACQLDKEQVHDENFEATDYTELEGYFTAFCNELFPDADWMINGLVEYTPGVIGGRELLTVNFTLSKFNTERYGE